MKKLLLLLAACLLMHAAFAGEAPALADDPALETRVQRLAEELRCLVCQNQTIADSHAGLAIDLKNQIREQLRAGRSDAEILDYMVERYGDFVLYRPPVKATTLLLWAGPFLLLAAGALVTVVAVRRRKPRVDACEFTGAQHAQAAALLADATETTT
jgi:cytochrome c-type biogenesis protein CcmH